MKGETENDSCGTGKEGARMEERERERDEAEKRESTPRNRLTPGEGERPRWRIVGEQRQCVFTSTLRRKGEGGK